jgi:hypothetical protein
VTVDLLDAPPFLLTPGDPGPMPWVPEEPPCWSGCCGEDPEPSARSNGPEASADDSLADADAFCAFIAAPPEPAVEWAFPGVPRPQAGLADLLTRLAGLVDELVAHGPLSGSRTDVTALLTQVERLRGTALRELAEMDTTGGYQLPGMRSNTASWLRDSRQLSDGAARATVALAVALRDEMPFIGELLLAGQITVEHAAAVRDGVRGLDADLITDAADGLDRAGPLHRPDRAAQTTAGQGHAIDDRLAAASRTTRPRPDGPTAVRRRQPHRPRRHPARRGRRHRPPGDGPRRRSRPGRR